MSGFDFNSIDAAMARLSFTVRASAVPQRASIDYAARFEGLDGDRLFEIEDEHNNCDAPREYVEQLLVVLMDWRRGILAEGRADEAAEYERCLNRVREAWLQWSFRCSTSPDYPYPFDLPRTEAQR